MIDINQEDSQRNLIKKQEYDEKSTPSARTPKRRDCEIGLLSHKSSESSSEEDKESDNEDAAISLEDLSI